MQINNEIFFTGATDVTGAHGRVQIFPFDQDNPGGPLRDTEQHR